MDPYKKPKDLVEVSPKGLVPALRLTGSFASSAGKPAVGVSESTVILDFLQDLHSASSSASSSASDGLLPPLSKPYERAVARSLGDKINRSVIPAFYRYLQAQDPHKQVEEGLSFKKEIEALVEALPEGKGPFALGDQIGWVDISIAPCPSLSLAVEPSS